MTINTFLAAFLAIGGLVWTLQWLGADKRPLSRACQLAILVAGYFMLVAAAIVIFAIHAIWS